MRLLTPIFGHVDTSAMAVGKQQRAGAPFADRFRVQGEPVHLTGLQALARLPLEQIRRDRAVGLTVRGFISGYPGSPLAGFDQLLVKMGPLLDEHGVRFQPGINEELAAAAVAGSQLLDLFPHTSLDGVIGLWFGKAPGVDRCLDVFRHANFSGISRFGGALLVAGDDPGCKSSSLPSQSDLAFAHALVPLLTPASPADVLELGLHAYAMSRYAGVLAGLRVVADVCDAGELVTVAADGPAARLPDFEIDGRLFAKHLEPRLLPPAVREIEHDLVYARMQAAREYAYANQVDRITESSGDDRLGFVAAGHHAPVLRSAFAQLGLGEGDRRGLGIRVLQLGMVFPVEERRLREFAQDLDTVVVLDDRQGSLEARVRDVLYGAASAPEILGKRDERGSAWLGASGAIDPERLARDLGAFLSERFRRPEIARRAQELQALVDRQQVVTGGRRPHFCSGCPHLTSTRVPQGLAAAGGIGCHSMVLLQGGEARYVGAMGSEGAHWNGLAPFVDTPHLFQNLGDGTYFHSGRQAVRACVAANESITFKLLYNGAIAMTGGQTAAGEKPVADVIRELLADGVAHVVVVSDDPAARELAASVAGVERVARSQADAAQRRLSQMPGVTAFVYDEECANARQRKQRRGELPGPERRVMIQRDVCEGCGDCGRKSECLSVHPVETSLGRKTEIHQGSCSQDEACLAGDCPAFVTVEADVANEMPVMPEGVGPAARVEEPSLPAFGRDYSLLMVGVGSTGVVTVDAILVAAAARAGLHAVHLDQTGLAQRGGRVTSHLRLLREPEPIDPRVPHGGADVLLAFDPLGAADADGLAHLDPVRTRTVAHQHVTPTAEMVSRPESSAPRAQPLLDRLASLSSELHALPAEPLAEALLGTHLAANVMLLGFAYQRGAIPIAADCIEAGIEDCGVAVALSARAFRLGRAFAADPDAARRVLSFAAPRSVGDQGCPERARERYGERWTELERVLAMRDGSGDELLSRIAGWAEDLADYQDVAYGVRYLRCLLLLAQDELANYSASAWAVTDVAARELYRLMAYKDEYEVARLHVRGPWRRWLDARAGGTARLSFRLHPPLLRAIGFDRKLSLGPWFEPVLALLSRFRFLRGTAWDPFGRTAARRLDRRLVDWYPRLLDSIRAVFHQVDLEQAVRIVGVAAEIRGYEEIRSANARSAIEAAERAFAEIDAKEEDA